MIREVIVNIKARPGHIAPRYPPAAEENVCTYDVSRQVGFNERIASRSGPVEHSGSVGWSSLNPVVQKAVTSIFRHIPQDRFVIPNPENPQDVETCICAVVKGLALLKRDGFPPICF